MCVLQQSHQMVHEVALREQQVAAVRGEVVQQVVVRRERAQQPRRRRLVRQRHARLQPAGFPPRCGSHYMTSKDVCFEL